MALESDAVAGATIELLEARLRRLTYLLTGTTDWTGVPTTPEKPASLDETVSRRLAQLESELERLSRGVPAVRDVLQLRMYPMLTLFTRALPPQHAPSSLTILLSKFLSLISPYWTINYSLQTNPFNLILTQTQSDDRNPDLFQTTSLHQIPEGLTTQTLASIVLSYATAFPETASRLTSLNDLPVPDAQSSAALINLQPQLDRLAQTQSEQAAEISELRVRTARVLQRWYDVGLVGSGECWAEWEGRLEDVEREVRRGEVVRQGREEA